MAAYNRAFKEPGVQFRQALLKISKQLEVKDLEEMKFLIAGLDNQPGFAELEDAKRPLSFFMILVKYQLICEDDTSFLENLLEATGQISLISQLRTSMKGVSEIKQSSSGNDSSSSSSHDSPVSSLEYNPDTSSSATDSGISQTSNTQSPAPPGTVSVHHQPPLAGHHQPPLADHQLQLGYHDQPPLADYLQPPLAQSTPVKSSQDGSIRSKIQYSVPADSELSTNAVPKDGYQIHHSPPPSTQINPYPQNYQDGSVRSKIQSSSSSNLSTSPASSREQYQVPTGARADGSQSASDKVTVASAVPAISSSSSPGPCGQQVLQSPGYLSGRENHIEQMHIPQQHPRTVLPPQHQMNYHQPRFATQHHQQGTHALALQQMPVIQDNVTSGRPQAPSRLTHSASCPEQQASSVMSIHQTPESHVSSFGFRPLISSDAHQMQQQIPQVPPFDLNRSMSAPNSSDFGPTILSPSVSWEDMEPGLVSTGHPGYQSSNCVPQSKCTPDRGLAEQMRQLGLQNQRKIQENEASSPNVCPSSDLETDAPDEERAYSTYLEESDRSFSVKGTSCTSDQPSVLYGQSSFPTSDATRKKQLLQSQEGKEVVTGGASVTGISFGMASNPPEEQYDMMARIKSKLQRDLAEQRSRNNQDFVEPTNVVDDKSTKKTKLRRYQDELAAPAMKGGNFTICAPTGCGKTLTAAAICRNRYDNAKSKGEEFKALFIVNMRHLTEQQTIAFRDTFPEGSVAMVGATDMLSKVVDVPSHAVIMVTAQILLNALKRKEPDVNLRDLSMIIFDECHHTTQDHPYNEIMKLYLKVKRLKLGPDGIVGESGKYLPQILGLSASLGVGHGNDAYRHILTLCGNLDAANVIQVVHNQEELKEFVNSPDRDQILYVRSREKKDGEFCKIVEEIMTEVEKEIWPNGVPETHGTSTYEQWVAETRKEAEANRERVHLVACLYLFEFNRALMLYAELRAVDALRHLEAFMEKRDIKQNPVAIEELCREYFHFNLDRMRGICTSEVDADNPMLDALGKLLRKKFEEKPHSKGIILSYSLNTEALTDFIEETQHLKHLQQPVKPTRLVGQGTNTETERYMTEHDQKRALQKFREDDSCNLLVATDIAQEGLDMPACNFVIRYNFVSNEIGTVQSKGRARAKQSECFLIVEENSKTAAREIQNRQNVKDMQAAMDRLNALPEETRIAEITKRQDEIYKEMVRNEEKAKTRKGMYNPDDVKMFCKECNNYITKASYIRTKGCHYTCIDPDIKQRIIVVEKRGRQFRTTINTGVFKCVKEDCGQQLGIAIDFLDKDGEEVAYHGYGFKIESFLFKLPDGPSKTYKKWKVVPVDFQEHED
ncbi:LOW QUALITY PROTEIN: uncharacterized protein [Amphiura filiformis]|uniref:LOW QUALITY PROTEIN: uncharacterized protein n=1 Tax=Amphiura filiformis TaxID=82378 RepID=UPI003B20EA29